MAGGSVCRGVLFGVNVVYAGAGVALAGVGVWAFMQLSAVTELRNGNHYLLDYEVHWPQVAPWLFVGVGAAALPVALCGLGGALGRGRGALSLHAAMLLLLMLAHAATAALVFLYVNGEPTDKFIKDSVYDGFHNAKTDAEVLKAFGRLEKRLRCCGADDATDYKTWHNGLDSLPASCCTRDTLAVACDFTDREANERHGCAKVAAVYAKRVSVGLAAGSAAVGLLELIGLATALAVLIRRTHARDHQPNKTRSNGLK